MGKAKIVFRWSEKEKDWFINWPAAPNAKPNAGLIMDHMTHAKTAYGTTLVEELATRGVKLKTLRLTIEVEPLPDE